METLFYRSIMERRVSVILTFLLLGAIVNVAVAWVLAVTLNVFDGGETEGQWRQIRRPGEFFWQGQSKHRTGGVWIAARFVRTSDDLEDDSGKYRGGDAVPSWSGFAQPTKEFQTGESQAVWRWGDGRGWPLLCLWSETKRYNDKADHRDIVPVQWGIKTDLSEWGGGNPHNMGPRVLPLRPICPGFAINTVFYAAILWLLFAAPFVLRRRRRIRRGLCPACGYRVGTSPVCTECGKPLPNRPIQASV